MRILLVQPPSRFFGHSAKPAVHMPVGLLSIAAMLEQRGREVSVFDAQVNVSCPVYRDPDGCDYVGQKWSDVEARIAEYQPDIVGVSTMFTVQLDCTLRLLEIVKKVNPKILTVVGGTHASIRPQDFFTKTGAADLACIGEGEYTMLDIVESAQQGRDWRSVQGTAVKDGSGVRINTPRPYIQDLDNLPLPAYHLVNGEDYFRLSAMGYTGWPIWHQPGFERFVPIVTSRGCPFDCVFCSIHGHMGSGWRYHSVSYVIKHIEFLLKKFSIRHITFIDDNLTMNRERFRALLDEFLARGMTFTWDTPNGVRVDSFTKEILMDCKRTGCTCLFFAVESGNKRVLNDIIAKRLDLDVVRKVMSWCHEARLDAKAFFVIGFPGETKEEMRDTVRFALEMQKRYDVLPSLFIATPLPGTRLEKIYMERGYLKEPLSPEILARMTSGARVARMEPGQQEGIKEMMAFFYKGLKKYFIRNVLIFFLRHPWALGRFAVRWFELKKKIGPKDAAFNLCEFKNCLLRRFTRS